MNRANIVIYDESRLMDKETIVKVINPLLTKKHRGQLWASSKKYKQYLDQEHNAKIFLTSIGYKDEWSYKDFLLYLDFISQGRTDYYAVSLPYQFGIEAGVIDESYVESVVREQQEDLSTIRMEFEVIPFGESEHAMFKFDQMRRVRKLRIPLIPVTDDEYIKLKGDIRKHECYQPKEKDEIRVIAMDLAVAAGRSNDNSVLMVFRLNPNGEYYDKEVAYIEIMNGINLDNQILRLKQTFYDLECDYCVLDAGGGLGITAMNLCGDVTRDNIRNKRYPGWKTMNMVDKFDMRVSDKDAEPVLFPVQVTGTSASNLQYNMLVTTQLEFDRGRLLLLISPSEAVDELNRHYQYMKLNTSNSGYDRDRAINMMVSFLNTDELIKEAINTQVIKTPNGRLTFDEGSGRKDRIITLLYGVYFINILENELSSNKSFVNIHDYYKASGAKKVITRKANNPFGNSLQKFNGFGGRR